MPQELNNTLVTYYNNICCNNIVENLNICELYYALGNLAGGFADKYTNPNNNISVTQLNNESIIEFRHRVVGFYKRPLGSSIWGTNLIIQPFPLLVTPIGTIPDFANFLNSIPTLTLDNLTFWSIGNSYASNVGSICFMRYNETEEFFLAIEEEVVSANNTNVMGYVFAATRQGLTGNSILQDCFDCNLIPLNVTGQFGDFANQCNLPPISIS